VCSGPFSSIVMRDVGRGKATTNESKSGVYTIRAGTVYLCVHLSVSANLPPAPLLPSPPCEPTASMPRLLAAAVG